MNESQTSLEAVYKGWDRYQRLLVEAVAPLTDEQLTLRAALHMRSLGEIATHILGARARWFNGLMGEGGDALGALANWDRPTYTWRNAADLVGGLELSWGVMQSCLARWTLADLGAVFSKIYRGEEASVTRQWVLWHLIEHDIHHGGELSLTLGVHGLAAPDL